MTEYFLGFLGGPERSTKPRKKGITMVTDAVPPIMLDRYSEYIDIIKLLEATMWAPNDVIKETIASYHKFRDRRADWRASLRNSPSRRQRGRIP